MESIDRKHHIDQIMTKDSFLVFEIKTIPYSHKEKLRPRIGHIIALALLILGALLVPKSVLGIIIIVTGIGMALVAFVFLVQMPLKTLIADRNAGSAVQKKQTELPPGKPVRRSEPQQH